MTRLQDYTILLAGYSTVLFGGIAHIGIGYVSPDMVAYALIGLLAWMTVLMQRGTVNRWVWITFGAALGLGYLDRSAFAPLALFYIAAAAGILWKQGKGIIRPIGYILAAWFIIGAPFAITLSLNRGRPMLGDSGKLNYGWEIAGAARSIHWQGEPGDIGRPLHPTRKLLTEPVPVFEFSEPVSGPYPPWYDPSYWYEGIQPHLKIGSQLRGLLSNLIVTLIYLALCPAVPIVILILFTGRWEWRGFRDWLLRNWALVFPPLAGIGTYCLVFVDKRYIAGFIAVFWLSVICALKQEVQPRNSRTESAARWLCLVIFLGALAPRMIQPMVLAFRDAFHAHESNENLNWLLAKRFEKIGIKPGDKIAFSGVSMNADWVRLAGCKIVAEVPIQYDRQLGLTNFVISNDQNPVRFANLSDQDRETVLDAFRRAGAVMAVVDSLPTSSNHNGWTRVFAPDELMLPTNDGQYPDGFGTYYRWLNAGH